MAKPKRTGQSADPLEVAQCNLICAPHGLNLIMHSPSHVSLRRDGRVVLNWWPTTVRSDIPGPIRPKSLQQFCELGIKYDAQRQASQAKPAPTPATVAPPGEAPPLGERRTVPPTVTTQHSHASIDRTLIDPRVLKVFCSLLANPEVVQAHGSGDLEQTDEALYDLDNDTDMEALVERAQQLVGLLIDECPWTS